MGTPVQVRSGLRDAVDTIDALQVYRFRQPSPQFPCAVIGLPAPLVSHPMQGAGKDMVIPVRVLVVVEDDESADDELFDYVESVPAAILADPTLGGACNDLQLDDIDFDVELADDGRVIAWFVIPVRVFT